MRPKVTFVIPCYNLAHFLPECVNSILSQSYEDFEILIMDDCSPDNTPEVARSFKDPRVYHIRNEPNLGHLRNYNKGIELSRGEYVWLISADDRLRRSDALQRYMDMAVQHPKVGYVFCPAMDLEDGQEKGVVQWTSNGEKDFVMNGRRFLAKLVHKNSVVAPSGMVRRECYEKLGAFPLDLPYAGDWYLWCLFALHFDVAYLAEPLVNYRGHGLSMTNRLAQRQHVADDLTVRWRIQRMASELGYQEIVEQCTVSLTNYYVYRLTVGRFRPESYCMTIEEFEESLRQQSAEEPHMLKASVYTRLGDDCYKLGERDRARNYYTIGLQQHHWSRKTWGKRFLLRMGKAGTFFRQVMASSGSQASIT